MVLEYMNTPWIQWTGGDIIQAGLSIVVVVVAYAVLRAIILASTKTEIPPPKNPP